MSGPDKILLGIRVFYVLGNLCCAAGLFRIIYLMGETPK